jgi:hypothetical protein
MSCYKKSAAAPASVEDPHECLEMVRTVSRTMESADLKQKLSIFGIARLEEEDDDDGPMDSSSIRRTLANVLHSDILPPRKGFAKVYANLLEKDSPKGKIARQVFHWTLHQNLLRMQFLGSNAGSRFFKEQEFSEIQRKSGKVCETTFDKSRNLVLEQTGQKVANMTYVLGNPFFGYLVWARFEVDVHDAEKTRDLAIQGYAQEKMLAFAMGFTITRLADEGAPIKMLDDSVGTVIRDMLVDIVAKDPDWLDEISRVPEPRRTGRKRKAVPRLESA